MRLFCASFMPRRLPATRRTISLISDHARTAQMFTFTRAMPKPTARPSRESVRARRAASVGQMVLISVVACEWLLHNFRRPMVNRMENDKVAAISSGICWRRKAPAKRARPRTVLPTRLMICMEIMGILIRLLPYAKLAMKASSESDHDRMAAWIMSIIFFLYHLMIYVMVLRFVMLQKCYFYVTKPLSGLTLLAKNDIICDELKIKI